MSNFNRLQGVEPEAKIAARLSNLQAELEQEVERLRDLAAQCTVNEVAEAVIAQADCLQAILDRSKGEGQ